MKRDKGTIKVNRVIHSAAAAVSTLDEAIILQPVGEGEIVDLRVN